MKSVRLAAALLLLALPARSWWDRGRDQVLALQADYNAGRFESVIAQLDDAGLQKLSGYSLKRGHTLLGASYERAGHPEKALGVYQVAVRLFPKDRELLGRLAQLLHESGLNEQAQPLYEKVLAGDPYNGYAHLGLARIDRALGFLDRSAEHYAGALESFPEHGGWWQEYAELLYEARDYRTAEPAARRALSFSPCDEGRLVLARSLRAQGRVDEALAELESPLRAGRLEAARLKALWLLEAGRDAAPAAETLLAREAGDPVGLYVRARLALRGGRRGRAREDLLRAAAQGERAPFTARVCAELARQIGGR